MRVTDGATDNRPDIRVTPKDAILDPIPAGIRPDTKGSQRSGLPTTVRRPASVVDIGAPRIDETPRSKPRQPGPASDAASGTRRQNARELIDRDVDVRKMTPREASDIGLDLYAQGLVTWDQYAELAFQPELHPSYNSTIGALLGEKAQPNEPRDYVQHWQERLAFEQRYNSIDSTRVKSTRRITSILQRLAGDGFSFDV